MAVVIGIYYTGVDSSQDLVWCVEIGLYMGYWVHRWS